jgi:hypothetical protein
MPNNPYPSNECESICDKLSRWELGKKNFKVLQTDLVYNSATNTYTGTYMNVEISGEIFMVEPENIIISPNTNTLLLNIAYDGAEIVPSITTEQKTVSEVNNIMVGNSYTEAGSTCGFSVPIQLDGKNTSSQDDCSTLNDLYSITPRLLECPPLRYNFATNQHTITAGNIVFEAMGEKYVKTVKEQTFIGNSIIIKIYGNINNFELIGYADATRPRDLKDYCKSLNSGCTFHYPLSTHGSRAFYSTYPDIQLSWAQSINVFDWSGEGVEITGQVNTRNQAELGWVRGGFKTGAMNKIPIDVQLGGMTTNNPSEGFNNQEFGVRDGKFAGENANWIGASFHANIGNVLNRMAYNVTQFCYDQRGGVEQIGVFSATSLADELPRLFFIKNNVGTASIVTLSFSTSRPCINWVNYD